mmetsp:Transcript_16066/g.32665  ORF Transcript_16066/g.32665 Transcript_16066/m.32665 type:complete len:224 (+) Transcript_16066:158-829(+)
MAVQLRQQLGHGRAVGQLDGRLHQAAALALQCQLGHGAAHLRQGGRPLLAAGLEGLRQGGAVQAARPAGGGVAARSGGLRKAGSVGPRLSCALAAQAPLRAGAESRPGLLLLLLLLRLHARRADQRLQRRLLPAHGERSALGRRRVHGPSEGWLLRQPAHVADDHRHWADLHGGHLQSKAICRGPDDSRSRTGCRVVRGWRLGQDLGASARALILLGPVDRPR